MKIAVFAALMVALLLGSAEGIRLYSLVESDDGRFVGMTVLVMPIVLTVVIAALHGLMFDDRQTPSR